MSRCDGYKEVYNVGLDNHYSIIPDLSISRTNAIQTLIQSCRLRAAFLLPPCMIRGAAYFMPCAISPYKPFCACFRGGALSIYIPAIKRAVCASDGLTRGASCLRAMRGDGTSGPDKLFRDSTIVVQLILHV